MAKRPNSEADVSPLYSGKIVMLSEVPLSQLRYATETILDFIILRYHLLA